MTAQTDAQLPLIDRDAIPTHSFDWGAIKWLVTPTTTPGARLQRAIDVLISLVHRQDDDPCVGMGPADLADRFQTAHRRQLEIH